jgi:septal ring factor EnvC (AmiA/AmiB activator)
MTKLTTSMRAAIVDSALEKAGVYKARAEYTAKRKAWANAVADATLGGPDALAKLEVANQKIARIVKTLPEQFQRTLRVGPLTGGVYASFGGFRTHVNEWDGERPALGSQLFAADDPLSVQFEELEREDKAISDKRETIRTQVKAALSNVNTVKQLLAAWPEAAELLPTNAAPKPTLPALCVADLNAAIGLPTGETE